MFQLYNFLLTIVRQRALYKAEYFLCIIAVLLFTMVRMLFTLNVLIIKQYINYDGLS